MTHLLFDPSRASLRAARWLALSLLALGVQTLGACACDSPCVVGQPCQDGSACELVAGSEAPQCVSPFEVHGAVTRSDDQAPIEGAEVVAIDAAGVVLGEVAITDADGAYVLRVSAPRDDAGAPAAGTVTLRVSAQGYERFPFGLRRPLPIDLGAAVEGEGTWVYTGTPAQVALNPLPAGDRGWISGQLSGDQAAGALVTAAVDREPSGLTGVSDLNGNYTIYNVPVGTYIVRAYAKGAALAPATGVEVIADTEASADLSGEGAQALGSIEGQVQPVAGGCSAGTSVVLVPRESLPPGTSFPLTAVSPIRGEVPRGLRAPEPPQAPTLSGSYRIEGVPAGVYEVLAAYENEAEPCVYDPSNTGGAFFVHEATLPEGDNFDLVVPGFKVTGAVELVGPGAAGTETVNTLAPTFEWAPYASWKNYQLAVYDSNGAQLWVTTICADGDSGCAFDHKVIYGQPGAGSSSPALAPALQSETLYQWRVIVMGSKAGKTCGFAGVEIADRECISLSEDLAGIFKTPVNQ